MKHLLKHLLMGLAITLLLVVPSAMASDLTGTIKGSVFKPDGAPLAGAKIVVESEALMGKRELQTQEGGRYIIPNLPPGVYTMKVTFPGLNPFTQKNIQVDVGRTVSLPIFMTSPATGEVIEIIESGSPTIDTEKTSSSEVLTSDFLEQLPTNRAYQGAIQVLPGVTGGANPNVQGSATNENAFVLDGVNITDPVTGTFSLNFPFDAIDQVEAITGGYGAEYGQAMGGITSVTTKSGGNEMSAKFSLYYQDSLLSQRLPALYTSSGFQYAGSEYDRSTKLTSTSMAVGGPLVKDKLWFFTVFNYERSQLTSIGVAIPRDFQGTYFMGKLTYQPTSEHQIAMSYFTNPTVISNVRQSRFVLPEAEATQAQGGGFVKLDWTWFLSQNTQIFTRLYRQQSYINVFPVPCTEDPTSLGKQCSGLEQEGDIDSTTIGYAGVSNALAEGNYTRLTFDDRIRNVLDISAQHYIADLFGEHQISGGVEANVLNWNYLNITPGNKVIVNTLINVYGDPTNQNNTTDNVLTYYTLEYTGPDAFSSTGRQLSIYAQDRWKPTTNLTVNYGLRFDRVTFANDVGETITSVSLLAPRVGASWAPFDDGSTRVYGNIGRYTDTGRFAISSFLNARGQGSKLILNEESFGDNILYSYDLGQSRYITAPNVVNPKSDELLLGAERELFYDIALGVEGVRKWARYLWEDDEISLIWTDDAVDVIGARYAGVVSDIYRLRTPEEAYRDYRALKFTARQRFSDKKLQLLASYTLSEALATTPTNLTEYLDVPQQDPFSYGYVDWDIRHQFKLNGAYQLPADISLGLTGQYTSGTPYEMLYYNDWTLAFGNREEPRNVHGRNGGWWQADLRFTKGVEFKEFGKLEASLDVFNLFNTRATTAIAAGTYNSTGEFYPGARQRPRQVQLGIRMVY